ncbi:MAG: hypothetical protein WCD21_18490 [Streptomyces sp.]
MGTGAEDDWNGKSTLTVDEWIAAELERAPDPTPEQRGNLTALFNGGSIVPTG